MARNFGVGSPLNKIIDPPATQQDSVNAVNIIRGFDGPYTTEEGKKSGDLSTQTKAKKNANKLISQTSDNIKKGKGVVEPGDVKQVLYAGDYKGVVGTKKSEELNLPVTKGGRLQTRLDEKRRKNLKKKAVKGTKSNTFGVLKSQKKK